MNILVLPSDDVGPEITSAALSILKRTDEIFLLDLQIDTQDVGMNRLIGHCRRGDCRPAGTQSIDQPGFRRDAAQADIGGVRRHAAPRATKAGQRSRKRWRKK